MEGVLGTDRNVGTTRNWSFLGGSVSEASAFRGGQLGDIEMQAIPLSDDEQIATEPLTRTSVKILDFISNRALREAIEQWHQDSSSTCPAAFICPITQVMMKDPCISPDGNTYEKDAIVEWFKKYNEVCQILNKFIFH